jgi:hypothetical protein
MPSAGWVENPGGRSVNDTGLFRSAGVSACHLLDLEHGWAEV